MAEEMTSTANNEELGKVGEQPDVTQSPDADKIAQLEMELAKLKENNTRLKSSVDKASAEASKYKNDLREKMSESEKAKAEQDEAFQAMQEELATLRKGKEVAAYTSSFVAMGYSEELASKRAEAIADGNMAEALEIEREFLVAHDKALKQEELRDITRPVSGTSATMTKEEIAQIKDEDARKKAIAENLHLFER